MSHCCKICVVGSLLVWSLVQGNLYGLLYSSLMRLASRYKNMKRTSCTSQEVVASITYRFDKPLAPLLHNDHEKAKVSVGSVADSISPVCFARFDIRLAEPTSDIIATKPLLSTFRTVQTILILDSFSLISSIPSSLLIPSDPNPECP